MLCQLHEMKFKYVYGGMVSHVILNIVRDSRSDDKNTKYDVPTTSATSYDNKQQSPSPQAFPYN